jgi:hypothetical protein
MSQEPELPAYDELPVVEGAPPGSSWGVWGDEDYLGTLNLQTPERALAAARSVRTGEWFSLNIDLGEPDPPLFARPAFVHRVTGPPGSGHDDILDDWNTQSSGQWDGFRHFPHRDFGFYGGLDDEAHGMHHWASRGIVARAVLVDVDRWRAEQGRPLRQGTPDPISGDDLLSCIEDQGTPVETGDVMLVRTGWLSWYRGLDRQAREDYAAGSMVDSPGLAGTDLPRLLWDMHVSALAADNPAVEMFPPRSGMGLLHAQALPLLGLPLGEMWDLDALAAHCHGHGTHDCLLTSAPINVRRGVGSPPNAIAIR